MKKDSSKVKGNPFVIRQTTILALSGLTAMVFVMGMIFPDTWWGTHFASFLPDPWNWVVLGLGLAFFSIPYWDHRQNLASRLDGSWNRPRNIPPWVVNLCFTFLVSLPFLVFTLAFDPYGDAPTHIKAFDNELNTVDHWKLFLNLDIFHFKTGERTVLNLAAILIEQFETTPEGAFAIIGRISGFLYVYIVVSMASRFLKKGVSFLLILLALISPAMPIFMGHIEIYAPLFPTLAGFASLAILYFQKNDWKWIILSVITVFLGLKFHLSTLLLVPLLFLMIVHKMALGKEWFQKRINWKNLAIWVLIPLLVGALVLYFFVLGDYNDSRDPNLDPNSYDRIFLPILTPNPPLERYNLFGGNHLLDFGNLIMTWSPLAILILFVALLPLRKKINWNSESVLGLGLLFILYFGFFFLLNPLLGMPLDWDLMAIPTPLLVLFTLSVLKESKSEADWKGLLGPAVGLAILVLPTVFINSQAPLLNERFIGIGKHSFRTYWVGSAGFLMNAYQRKLETPIVFEDEFSVLLEDLKPFANEGNDIEYAVLAKNFGAYFRLKKQNRKLAEKYHLLADKYDPQLSSNLEGLTQLFLEKQDYPAALAYAKRLVALESNDQKGALRLGLEIALKAKDWEQSMQWIQALLKFYPNDADLNKALRRLETQTELDRILELFGQ